MEENILRELLLMHDDQIRQALGTRIKELRKQNRWTQKELASKIGVRFPQLNKYEGGLHVPPVDKLIRLAEVFQITLDYLITGQQLDGTPLHNHRLLERFRELEHVTADDQETVIKLIDAVIAKRKMELVLRPLDKVVG